MTESPRPDDRLLDAAAAIARGEPVDWAQLPVDTDADSTTVVAQLRALEGLSQQSEPVPGAWGPFTILGEIGHGSFGTVYRAIDPNLNIEIALKVVRPRQPITDGDFTRALTEARILAQINHPHVVRVFQVQRIDQEVGLSMELVKGRTLHNIVKTDGPLSANESMLLGIDLCQALAAVHGAQLLHGDIKAHNVMRAEGGRIVLMDFGAGDDLKRDQPPPDRRVTGTPLYLAPELFDGGVRTRLSDIYSVGVLLYHAATRGYPVEGSTREEVEQQHASRTPRRLLRDIGPHLPDAFISVVERATARRPEDRYQTRRRARSRIAPGASTRGACSPSGAIMVSPKGCARGWRTRCRGTLLRVVDEPAAPWRRLGTTPCRPVQRRRDPCHAVSNRSGVLSRTRWGRRPAAGRLARRHGRSDFAASHQLHPDPSLHRQ